MRTQTAALKIAAYLKAFFAKDEAATAIEYGLIAAGVAVTISGTILIFSDNVVQLFNSTSQAVDKIP